MTARVLVVDDEPSVRLLARLSLEDAGYEVEEAGSGPAALTAVASAGAPFGAVVMDFRMPGMTGVEAAERLREAGVRTPVVLYTAWADPRLAAAAADLGFALVDKDDVLGLVARVGALVAEGL